MEVSTCLDEISSRDGSWRLVVSYPMSSWQNEDPGWGSSQFSFAIDDANLLINCSTIRVAVILALSDVA